MKTITKIDNQIVEITETLPVVKRVSVPMLKQEKKNLQDGIAQSKIRIDEINAQLLEIKNSTDIEV